MATPQENAMERAEADLGGSETVSETIGQVFAGYQCGTLQVRVRARFADSLSPKPRKSAYVPILTRFERETGETNRNNKHPLPPRFSFLSAIASHATPHHVCFQSRTSRAARRGVSNIRETSPRLRLYRPFRYHPQPTLCWTLSATTLWTTAS